MNSLSLQLDIAELAWNNLTEDDHAETIAKAYPSHDLEVEYIYEPGRPASIRADPGDSHPEEPEEVEIILNARDEAASIAVAIIGALPAGSVARMTDSLFNLRLGIADYLNKWIDNDASELAFEDQKRSA
jgi:hypothetical protein